MGLIAITSMAEEVTGWLQYFDIANLVLLTPCIFFKDECRNVLTRSLATEMYSR